LSKAKLGPINLSKYTFAKFYDDLYGYLKDGHRSEYIYKNAIATKILLGKHSIKTSTLISELRVAETKADIAIFNGTSTVYEIKSKFDNTNRLDKQIEAYQKMFDKIYVVTDVSLEDKIIQSIPSFVGVVVLTDRYTLSKRREAASNKAYVIPEVIFKSFNKKEYLAILKLTEVDSRQIPNTQVYEKARKWFCSLDPVRAHDLMVSLLRARQHCRSESFVEQMPEALKFIALAGLFKAQEEKKIERFLSSKIKIEA
jgi:hypothetical protein